MTQVLEDQGLYRRSMEHDNCGVAMVADVEGRRSHRIVAQALSALARLEHRGATGSDPLTGDGAGVLTQLPHRLLSEVCPFPLPDPGAYGVGMMFLPPDPWGHPRIKARIERGLYEAGLSCLGWREVPVDESVCGPLARESAPAVCQVFVERGDLTEKEFDQRLYLARKNVERFGRSEHEEEQFYFCSFSSRTIVYKGLLLPDRLAEFYRDLADPRYESAVAVVHQRF
ncbi:MAG: glutamate synthase subunit alpha, partial [Myxococcota bacterium]